MRQFACFAPAAFVALSACLLPSARPVAYQPHPERVNDPIAVLRRAAQSHCKKGVEVALLAGKLQYRSSCSIGLDGAPVPEDIELSDLSSIQIVFGDWYQVVLVRGGKEEHDHPALACNTSEEATTVADALLALRDAARP